PATNVGAFRAQSLQSYNGKVLRIDPMTGYGVPSNPYYNAANPDGVESKIWALGMRQPFSLTIRPGSGSTNASSGNPGAIYVNDVGFYNWEEENVVTAPGQNFGWPIYEGFLKHPNFSSANVYNLNAPNPLYGTGGCTTPYFKFADLLKDDTQGPGSWPNPCNTSVQIPANIPVFKHRRGSYAYKHGTPIVYVPEYTGNNPLAANLGSPQTSATGTPFDGSCIMGSAWIPNNAWPAKYHDAMFFMDYDKGWIRYAKFDANHKLVSIDTFATNVGRPVTMQWHPIQKCIYWVDYISGQLHRIKYTVGANLAPVAIATQNKVYGASPVNVQFDGTASYDPETAPLTYFWSFGNGVTSTLANPSITFTAPTSGNIILIIWTSCGAAEIQTDNGIPTFACTGNGTVVQ
ncbi:MAG TPA: PKD domain-containing protein, partial [Bacteroidia bacterium]|nr:PKD domain-containing protein [Bacteroidia bacterium]